MTDIAIMNMEIKPGRGRPRIHPITAEPEEIKKRGARVIYNTEEERREGKKVLDRKYYSESPLEKIVKVRAYQALNIEHVREVRRLYYIKKKLEKLEKLEKQNSQK
jgi:hypothetical protein